MEPYVGTPLSQNNSGRLFLFFKLLNYCRETGESIWSCFTNGYDKAMPEPYLRSFQTATMELFAKIINGFWPLIVFAKSSSSMIDFTKAPK